MANAGDPDGRGSATVLIRGTTLCFGITVDGIESRRLRIHQAPAGENGPIVVDLIPPANGNPGHRGRCLHNLDGELLKQIREHASGFTSTYIMTHTLPGRTRSAVRTPSRHEHVSRSPLSPDGSSSGGGKVRTPTGSARPTRFLNIHRGNK